LIPVELRDKLYALFMECLAEPDSARSFDSKTRRLRLSTPEEREYMRDRLPRYVSALAGAAASPPSDAFERDLEIGELLFNHGLFFDAHEYLEGTWRREKGKRKSRVQGFIQIAAAFHKLELDPNGTEGALYLLSRGVDKVGDDALSETLRPALKDLTAGQPPKSVPAVRFA
jgi:Domain of unknown function (DUF309)